MNQIAPQPHYELISKRVRVETVTQIRERQCIGPAKFQRSKDRGLCIGPGSETKGWLPEEAGYFATKPRYRWKTRELLEGHTYQARCIVCDRARVSVQDTADKFRDLPFAQLKGLSDEELALAAQMVPEQRNDAFAILIKRTEGMRQKAAYKCAVSRGYSFEDTVTSSIEGVYWAVWSFKTSKKAKFSTHAHNWIKRYSENRTYASQPLHDQFSANKRDENGERIRGARFLSVPALSCGEAVEEGDYQGAVFDGVAGGCRDADQGMIGDLYDSLDTLKDEYRDLVVRKYLNGESDTELAESLGVSRKTVSNRLKTAFTVLRLAMQGYNEE